MIASTVRQAIRINSVTAVFEHWVASQANLLVLVELDILDDRLLYPQQGAP
jgi:hypothetical protein